MLLFFRDKGHNIKEWEKIWLLYLPGQEIFEEADDILGMGLSKIIFYGDEQQLRQTEITQPAILTTSMAILTVLKERGLFPDGTAGLSLGSIVHLFVQDP